MDAQMLRSMAKELGFGELGICSVSAFDAQRRIVEEQPPLHERRQLRFEPQADVPWARALLVLLWPYRPARLPADADEVFVDSYYLASHAAYHAAARMQARLQAEGWQARANVSYPAREAAVRAGLGIIGRNGLLITPEYGTRVVILLMATDAVCAEEPDAQARGTCIGCGRCERACPMGALDERGMSHPERCLRNFMMEGIVAPEEVRERMGMRLIGCDCCQRACPMQPKLDAEDSERFLLSEFVTADDSVFRAAVGRLAERIGRNAARPQRVRAQAALLAGNRRDAQALPVLSQWAESAFDAVREHARWAAGRITAGLDQSAQKR